MADETKKKLNNEIESVLDCLERIEPDSENYKTIVENLETLYRLKIDENTTIVDELKNLVDNKTKLILGIGGLVIATVFDGVWMRKGLRFEQTGSFNATTYRWWMNNRLLKKFKI